VPEGNVFAQLLAQVCPLTVTVPGPKIEMITAGCCAGGGERSSSTIVQEAKLGNPSVALTGLDKSTKKFSLPSWTVSPKIVIEIVVVLVPAVNDAAPFVTP
jgi:hypothetical protein